MDKGPRYNYIGLDGLTTFVKEHAVGQGPIHYLTMAELEVAIAHNLIVLAMFGSPDCENPKLFGSVALTLKRTGVLDRLNATIAKVDIDPYTWAYSYAHFYGNNYSYTERRDKYRLIAGHLKKFGFECPVFSLKCPSFLDCDRDPEKLIRLFKYGKIVKYKIQTDEDEDEIEDFTPKTMLKWVLDTVKPTTKPILTLEELQLITKYNQVSVVGYFEVIWTI